MSRNTATITKPFVLDDHEWTPMNARFLDQFCEDVTRNSVALRAGTYTGIGVSQTIAVTDLPQPPVLVVLQPSTGGTCLVTMMASSDLTALTRAGFTLAGTSSYNQSGLTYRYLVFA